MAGRRLPALRSAVAGVLAVALVTLLGACSAGEGGAGVSEGVIYVSLPLSGSVAGDGQDAADGAELALAEAGGEVAGVELRMELLDDAKGLASYPGQADGSGGELRWDEVITGDNARAATEDAAAIAYLGDLDSGATRTSLPITNEAGLPQVSPASAAMDLVREPGSFNDPPEDFALGGDRTFIRVIPGDEAQAEAAAELARRERVRSVSIQADGSAFGEVLADGFERAAGEVGLRAQPASRSASPAGSAAAADALFLAGTPETLGGPVDDARLAIVPDAFIGPSGERLTSLPSRLARGRVAVTSAALDPSQLTDPGFEADFEAEYGRDPGRFAAYGYEAMSLILGSIDRAAIDGEVRREDLVAALFSTSERDSVLGAYSIDDDGQTTLRRLGSYQRTTGVGLRPGTPIELP
ncbi:MAG: ABC transporter substrate-binding protein [Solirubrobacterales bacterium]|nr:ABC transporter substrate-binding protein [Solirubrobacterales bacterium]